MVVSQKLKINCNKCPLVEVCLAERVQDERDGQIFFRPSTWGKCPLYKVLMRFDPRW